jgi:hypothetical protein
MDGGPDLVRAAQRLADDNDAGDAFFGYFAYRVERAAANGGPVAAPAGSADDLEGVERALLQGAQDAGAVRGDVTHADVRALMAACAARKGEAARRRMVGIARGALTPVP